MVDKKIHMVFFLFFFLFFLSIAIGQDGAPAAAAWKGTVEIDGNSTTDGAIVEAFINNVIKGNTTVGTYTSGYYVLDVACTEGQNITIKVYGVEANQSEQTCYQGNITELNLTMNKTGNGVTCTYAGGCTSGFCVDSYCCNEACDGANEDCNVTGSLGTCTSTVTTTTAATTTAAPTGGGPTGVTLTTTTTPATTTVATTTIPVAETETVESIGAGETGTFTFETLPITDIEVKVKNDVSDVQITITKTDTAPATVAIAASGQVHSYLEIEKQNIEDEDIESVKIRFKVELSWIQNNDIDEDSIALYRYSDGEWTKLPTIELRRDSNYIYFEAESPGLSVFAISGEKKAVTTVLTTVATTLPTTVPEVPLEVWGMSALAIGLVIIIIIIVLVVINFLFVRRYKGEEKIGESTRGFT